MVPGRLMVSDLESGMKLRNVPGSDLVVLAAKDGALTIWGAQLVPLEDGRN